MLSRTVALSVRLPCVAPRGGSGGTPAATSTAPPPRPLLSPPPEHRDGSPSRCQDGGGGASPFFFPPPRSPFKVHTGHGSGGGPDCRIRCPGDRIWTPGGWIYAYLGAWALGVAVLCLGVLGPVQPLGGNDTHRRQCCAPLRGRAHVPPRPYVWICSDGSRRHGVRQPWVGDGLRHRCASAWRQWRSWRGHPLRETSARLQDLDAVRAGARERRP